MQKAPQDGQQVKGFAVTKVAQFFLVDEVCRGDGGQKQRVALCAPYEKYRVKELSTKCGTRGLKKTGLKADLVQRLTDDDSYRKSEIEAS